MDTWSDKSHKEKACCTIIIQHKKLQTCSLFIYLFVVFRRDSGDELLTAGWVCFIVVGLILVGIGVLGWIGAMKRNSLFMMLVSITFSL